MNRILDRNIKELIEEYPQIVGILSGFSIGCTTCSIGTCRLRDIIEIHALSEADEERLFADIAQIVYPGQKVAIPKLPRKTATSGTNKRLSPPIRTLVDEHLHIKKVLAALPGLLESIETTLPQKKETLLSAIDFIRNYADRFHHAKEEDLLFKLFDETAEIIAVMYKEHDIGRGHIKAAIAALHAGQGTVVREELAAYGTLLAEHIRKEDEILYPWMDRQLSDAQVGNLYSKFAEVENAFGDVPAKHVAFANALAVAE